MGWFSSSKQVNSREMRDVRGELRSKGFSDADLKNVAKMASGDMEEGGVQKGMDKHEVQQLLKDMDKHPSWHTLSPHQREQLKESLEKRL